MAKKSKPKAFKVEWTKDRFLFSLTSCQNPSKLDLAYLWVGDPNGDYLFSIDFLTLERKLKAFRKRATQSHKDNNDGK